MRATALACAATEAALTDATALRRRVIADVIAELSSPTSTEAPSCCRPLIRCATADEAAQLFAAMPQPIGPSLLCLIFWRALDLGDADFIVRVGALRFRRDEKLDNEFGKAARRVWEAGSSAELHDLFAALKRGHSIVHEAIAARGFGIAHFQVALANVSSASVLATLDDEISALRVDGARVYEILARSFARTPPPIAGQTYALPWLVRAYALVGHGETALAGIVSAVEPRLR
jgi:hypothetical protein